MRASRKVCMLSLYQQDGQQGNASYRLGQSPYKRAHTFVGVTCCCNPDR